ncbi:hypothetical protein AXF42_Ash009420 [Apostasia shenzhenica]|uniref:TMEM205-like domain-containing protein n=1 Tax=Apostasia shenzhenica TaxID=1088818 RepID=A0A2I0B418_9ASPA|nr:hypothetical protein AXF42_Ash009420 [Apostasia shenzhenica]
MMNVLALALLLSSLAAAGVFSPTTGSTNTHPTPPLAREGHRLIVVEYERQVPPGSSALISGDFPGNEAGEAKDKLLPHQSQPAQDKISDAYGACKEKISNLFTKAKNRASELEESAIDAVKSASETTKGKVEQLQESAADALKSTAESAADAVKLAGKTTKEKAERFQESAADAIANITERASGVKESAIGAVKSPAIEDVSADISAVARKAADRTEEAARDLADILRRARELARDAAAYVASGACRAARTVAAGAHLLGFATAYGTCVWVTFASSHVLASALPRQQFGIVQSRLYPVYFKAMAFSVAAALAGHFLYVGRRSPAERAKGYDLLAVLVMVTLNMLYLEPRATKVMFERMKIEKEEGCGSAAVTAAETEAAASEMVIASKRLKRLNSYSSFLNVLSLMGLSWHLVHLAQLLDSSCSTSV